MVPQLSVMLLGVASVRVAGAIVGSLTLMQQEKDSGLPLLLVVWHFAFPGLLFKLPPLVFLIMKIYTII